MASVIEKRIALLIAQMATLLRRRIEALEHYRTKSRRKQYSTV
jgi:hypothetical protein